MKNLLQISRNISTKFCWQKSRPSENHEEDLIKIESKEISPTPINREKWKLSEKKSAINHSLAELSELKDLEEIKELLTENNIDASLSKSPIGLTEELNRTPEVAFDLDSEEFNYANAIKETNNLLAQLDDDIQERGFGPMA